jgi:hypothetical protein
METTKVINNAINKFGWSAVEKENGNYILSNRKSKPVVTVKMKGNSYTVIDSVGTKLMSGRGQLALSLEKLLRGYFYAIETRESNKKSTSKNLTK